MGFQRYLLKYYKIDCRSLRLGSTERIALRPADGDSYYDEYDVRWRHAAYYYDVVERPLSHATLADLAKYKWPDPNDPGRVVGLAEAAQHLHDTTDYALVAGVLGGPFEQACIMRGYDQFCIDLASDPPFASTLLELITDNLIGFWDAFLTAVGSYVQVVAHGDDLGMQTGPFISPRMYRRFIKPCHRRLFGFIHAHTNAHLFLHSCGSVYDLLPDLIETGVEILNPVQATAAKMDLARLKREFGKDLTFWGGGIDVQKTLPFSTPAEIGDQVRQAIDILAPGGGFVFAPSHNIQADVSPERLDAAYQAALARRHYRNNRGIGLD